MDRTDDGTATARAPRNPLPALKIRVGDQTFTVQADDGPVTIGREFPAQIQVPDPRISRSHLRIEARDGQWTGSDYSTNGTFHAGARERFLILTDGITVHLGNADGFPVHFAVDTAGSRSDTAHPVALEGEGEAATDRDRPDRSHDAEVTDPHIARVGAAVAARRRELDIPQRTLARDKIVNAGSLIAFEKGRSWPHSSTRAKLEKVLKWPPGTIDRIKEDPTFTPGTHRLADSDPTEVLVPTVQLPLMAEAVKLALDNIVRSIDHLPDADDDTFRPRITALLNDLRKLETLSTDVARKAKDGPGVLLLTGNVRKTHREVMLKAAAAPLATLGQRLFAARHRAQLSISELASAAGVSEDIVIDAEADRALDDVNTQALQRILDTLVDL